MYNDSSALIHYYDNYMPSVTPDEAAGILWGTPSEYNTLLFIGRKDAAGNFRQETVRTSDITGFLPSGFSDRCNYYVSANTFKNAKNPSSDENNLFSLRHLVLDLDCHDNSSGMTDDSVWSRHAVLWLTDSIGLPVPDLIVFTGRGYQVWWTIEEASARIISVYKAIRSKIYNVILSHFSELPPDNPLIMRGLLPDRNASFRPAGLYRLPGSPNLKCEDTFRAVAYRPTGSRGTTLQELSECINAYIDTHNNRDVEEFTSDEPADRTGMTLSRKRCLFLSFIVRNRSGECTGIRHTLLHLYANFNREYPDMPDNVNILNSTFTEPLREKEINNIISSATKKYYKYKNTTFLEMLSPSDGELRFWRSLGSIHDNTARDEERKERRKKREKEIKKLIRQGKSNMEIAQMYDTTYTDNIRAVRQKITPKPTREAIRKMKLRGFTLEQIAKHFSVSRSTIHKILADS